MTDCGCKLQAGWRALSVREPRIDYCPLHAAAEQMREALAVFPHLKGYHVFHVDWGTGEAYLNDRFKEYQERARAALAAAGSEGAIS